MTSSFPTVIRAMAIAAMLTATGAPSNAQNTAQKILIGNARVTMIQSYNGDKLPKPNTAVVYNFNVPSDVITIDNSAAARLSARSPIAARKQGTSGNDQDPAGVAANVQTVFSQTIVKELNKTSIPTTPGVSNDASVLPAGTLTIHGDFTAVNEGNQTKRVMIGLGRGASDVQAHVTVSLLTDSAPITLVVFDLDSQSGKKPGAAATMGVSGASSVATSQVTDNKATVEGDTTRMAKAVAKEIENIMAAQGWIAAPAQPNAPPAPTSLQASPQ